MTQNATAIHTDPATDVETTVTSERADLLDTLAKHRYFLCLTVRELSDAQATRRTTTSELCLAGLIKHVASTEQSWMTFVLEGPSALGDFSELTETDMEQRAAEFQVREGETLAGLLEHYADVARRTSEIVAALPDLDVSHPLPEAPWFEEGAHWSARRVLLHIIAETAQHAGHADIIRESLDGTKSMG